MKAKRKAKKGVTLVEVIISLALIAIFMIPISRALITTAKRSKQAEVKQEATSQAQKILDQFSNLTELKYSVDPTNNNRWLVEFPCLPDVNNNIVTIDKTTNSGKIEVKQEYHDPSDKNADKTQYKVIYNFDKSNKVSQNLFVDNTTDEEKYAAIIKYEANRISYGFDINNTNNEFNCTNYIPYSQLTSLNTIGRQIYLNIRQSSTGEINGIDICDKNNPSYMININIPNVRRDKKKIKIVQTEDYQSHGETNTIYASSIGANSGTANIEFFREYADSGRMNNHNDIRIKLDDKYLNRVVETPKLTPKNICNGVYNTTPIGDLYMLEVKVMRIQKDSDGNDEEVEVFKGEASSNINFVETP